MLIQQAHSNPNSLTENFPFNVQKKEHKPHKSPHPASKGACHASFRRELQNPAGFARYQNHLGDKAFKKGVEDRTLTGQTKQFVTVNA